jgi:hypothetical protein
MAPWRVNLSRSLVVSVIALSQQSRYSSNRENAATV